MKHGAFPIVMIDYQRVLHAKVVEYLLGMVMTNIATWKDPYISHSGLHVYVFICICTYVMYIQDVYNVGTTMSCLPPHDWQWFVYTNYLW